jgi:biopolymer transport protein ExbB/TolQ
MDAIEITYLVGALAAIAAAIFGLNALVGRGPRGSVWMVAACLFCFGVNLPFFLRDPDGGAWSRELELATAVLQLSGLIGAILGILDVLEQKESRQRNASLEWILRQPLVWAVIIWVNFYRMLALGTIDSPLLERYTAGHLIERIEMMVFCVGGVTLVLRLIDLVAQYSSLRRVKLEPIPAERQTVADCGRLLAHLRNLPERLRTSYLARRLHDAIAYVRRTESADGLDQHLRHLEEQEVLQIQSSYSMVRIIVWSLPILGLLGTVIGITIAVANLNPATMEESIAKVTGGLAVAFDHTATALALTMILMFIKSGVERVEDRLLARVDARVSAELVGRFQQSEPVEGEQDPNVAAVRRMSDKVLSVVEKLSNQQADVWKAAMEKSNQHWAEVSASAGQAVKESLAASIKDTFTSALSESIEQHSKALAASTAQHADKLDKSAQETVGHLREGLEKLAELLVESLHRHGEVLTISEKELAQENRRHLSEVEAALGEAMVVSADRQEQLIKQSENLLKEMQVALVEAAGATVRQQEQLVKQGDVLLSVVGATGQIKKLETTLNENLATLRQGYHFEELALNLSAAIQLLCARLGHLPATAWAADDRGDDRASRAA